MKPTWFDRSIEYVAPVWGARRAAARFALEQARGYAAAGNGRKTEGWRAANTSANAEIGHGAERMRSRIRSLVRDNPHAASAVGKLSAKMIGAGIVPRLIAGKDEVERKAAAMSAWSSFVDNADPEGQLDFYGQQDLLAKTVFESGEGLIRFLPRPSSWKLKVPLQTQILEGDFLDSSKNEALDSGGLIIQGVEYDKDGRRAAYWLFDEHPGESAVVFTRRLPVSRRVPAAEIRHVFRPYRPGQARGVSIFAPVALRLRDIEDYQDAEMWRKKIAACFAAFVKKSAGAAASPLAGAKDTRKDGDRRIERLAPGRVDYLEPGEEITFATPAEAGGYVEYMRHELHAVAAGLGIMYQQMTGDLSQFNYSSGRFGLIDFWDIQDQWQWLIFIRQACVPVWNRVGSLMVVTGQRSASTDWRAAWAPPRRRWVDPKNEVAAARDEVRAGFVSLRAKIAETGEDPDEVMGEISTTNKFLDDNGIVLDSDPRKIARGGNAQSVDNADPAETDPKPGQE